MADVVKESQARHRQWLADQAAAAEDEKARKIRESHERAKRRTPRGVVYDERSAGARQRAKLNESIKAQQAAESDEAAGDGNPIDPGTAAQERGKRDFAAGMGLVAEADRTVAVTRANPTFGAVKGYTDTMGHGAQREGRFVGVRPEAQAAAAAAPAPVQVVVQAPAAPSTPPTAPAAPPTVATATPVPEAARATGAPGAIPSPAPSMPAVPLEGDPEVVAADQAALEKQLAAMTPAQQAEWLRQEGERLDRQAGGAGAPPATGSSVPAGAVPARPPGPELDKGVLQRTLNAGEDLAQAQVDLEDAKASALEEAAARQQVALEEQRAAEVEEAARVEAQLEARKAADQEIATATRAFNEAQTLSPQQAWADMGAGRKVAFLIGALGSSLRVLGGASVDPLARIREAVTAEVDAQQAAVGKLGQNLDAARARGDSAAAVYANVLQQVGDERQARAITEVARLNQIKADFEARLAREGVKALSAEQEAFLVGLEETIAGKQLQIDVQTAKNPRTITRAVHVYGKGQREAMKLGGRTMIESGVKGVEGGEEWRGKAALQGMELEGKAAIEREKRLAEKAEKTEGRIYSEMATFADKTAAGQQTVGLIDNMLAQDDIAGYGLTAGPTVGNAASNVEADLEAVAESFGRLQSQGVISPDEEVRFRKMLKDGTELGGEKRLRQNLKRVKGMVNLKIEAYERGLSPEARAYYRRNKNNPDFASQWTGGTGRDVVQVDE